MFIRKPRQGFTLLEVALSMGLFSFSLLGLLGLLVVLDRVEAENAWASKTLFCAQQAMEKLRFQAARGELRQRKDVNRISRGVFQGMTRQREITASGVETGLFDVRVECSCSFRSKTIVKGLKTLVVQTCEG